MQKVLMAFVMVLCMGIETAAAKEKPIQQLPKDIWDLAWAWTEPIKYVAKETRRFDPVSGVWFGLVEGSVKSVERTAAFFLPDEKDQSGPEVKSGKLLYRYSF